MRPAYHPGMGSLVLSSRSLARALARALALAGIVALAIPAAGTAQQQSNSRALAPGDARLIYAPTDRVVLEDSTELLEDSTELKEEPERMARIGTRIFAEQVARTVRAGGVVNDFPNGVPTGA